MNCQYAKSIARSLHSARVQTHTQYLIQMQCSVWAVIDNKYVLLLVMSITHERPTNQPKVKQIENYSTQSFQMCASFVLMEIRMAIIDDDGQWSAWRVHSGGIFLFFFFKVAHLNPFIPIFSRPMKMDINLRALLQLLLLLVYGILSMRVAHWEVSTISTIFSEWLNFRGLVKWVRHEQEMTMAPPN